MIDHIDQGIVETISRALLIRFAEEHQDDDESGNLYPDGIGTGRLAYEIVVGQVGTTDTCIPCTVAIIADLCVGIALRVVSNPLSAQIDDLIVNAIEEVDAHVRGGGDRDDHHDVPSPTLVPIGNGH